MNTKNNFDFDEEEEFEGVETIKNMLVSEIELIRDGLTVINMFLGEPAKAMVEYLKIFDKKN
jgi:hypothetical protein